MRNILSIAACMMCFGAAAHAEETFYPLLWTNPQINTEAPAQAAAKPAESTTPYVPYTAPSVVEAGLNYYAVNNNYGNWFGEFVNVQYQADPWNRWGAGLQQENAFHDSGDSASISNMHTFNEDWFSNVAFATSTSASFLPRYRVDADIDRKWLDNRNLVTGVGISWDQADKIYSDRAVVLSAAYYFQSPWIVQGSVRINESNPGSAIAPSFIGALTYGYAQRYYITGRIGVAREAYDIVGNSVISNGFDSELVGANWRQWVGKDWGFNLGSEYYTNPYYHRAGGTISLFKEF